MIAETQSQKELGYTFGKRPYAPPDTYYLGLSYTPLTNGAGYSEPSASAGYARMAIPNNTDTWQVPSGYSVTNLAQLTFNTFTSGASTDPNVTHWFISESETGGTAIYFGALTRSRPIIADSQIWINTGEIIIERRNES